jgi:diguanylate cyclase (GGDEF)-like protein
MSASALDQILRTGHAGGLRDLLDVCARVSGATRALLVANSQRVLSTHAIAWDQNITTWKTFDCAATRCQLMLYLEAESISVVNATLMDSLARQFGKLLDAYLSEQGLRQENQSLLQALSASGTGVWRLDVGSGVFEGDTTVAQLFGMTPDFFKTDFDSIIDLIDERERTAFLYSIGRVTHLNQRQRQIFQVRISGRWILAIFERDSLVQDRIHFIGVMQDYSAQREAEIEVKMHHEQLESLVKSLRKSSRIDTLTKLSNRTAFNETMQTWTVSARAKGEWISLLIIDVDHFKAYNDSYGHDQGDAALRRVAQAIEQSVRGKDLSARFGGEEFCYLTLSEPDVAEKIAERIRQAVAQVSWPLRPITVSIGVCCLQGGDIDATMLFKRADEALYFAKASGRNRCQMWTKQTPIANAV